nr:agamous-like MADS-box protein AGL61 [Ipomoea batatas]
MSSNNSNRKASRGRQRIPLSRIESNTNCTVTSSKRRNGLIKKANVISTLCGVKILLHNPTQSNKTSALTVKP